jgi:Tol biopolymer transport system component
MVGSSLGHYQIERLLGSGGMGEVYLASDTRLGRRVALKVLGAALVADPDRRERFEREARAAAALNHPNIVTIHSVEEAGGIPFLTLELIEGQTLAEAIPADGLPLDRVLAIGIPLADAVGAAHQRGITHRDLKPANVMLTSDGRVKVLDFGLAKVMQEVQLEDAATMPTRGMTAGLTGEGRVVGTAAYMSPEQAEGRAVDQRSDVFSLGIILYELATGVRPFQGDTHMSVLSSIIKDTPKPISDVRPGLPRELAKIIARCLAKDVEDRYQSAKDLRNDLRALKNEITSGEIQPITTSSATQPAAPPARRGVGRAAMAAGVLAVMAAGAGVAWWASRGPQALAPPARPFDAINLTRLTTTGTAGLAAISRDGRYVAHVSTRDGKQSLWLRQVATTSNVEIVPPEEVRYAGVSFSPDGNYIYYATYARGANLGQLRQVGVLGGGARLVMEDVDTAVTFAPDGTKFAFMRGYPDNGGSGLIVANADGSGARELVRRTLPRQFSYASLSWSPDGRLIAAGGSDVSTLRGHIAVIDATSGAEQVLPTPDWRGVADVAWLPGSTALLVNAQESAGESSSQIFLVEYPGGAARRLTNDLTSYAGLSVAPDGRSFVCIRNDLRVAIWTLPLGDPAKASAITAEAGSDDGAQGLSVTSDGRIVYTTEASGNPDIWIMAPDGSRRVQLTSSPGQDVSPRATADGRYIVFVSDRDGAMNPWRMGADGSSPMRLSTDSIARSRVMPSSDGQWVFYSTTSGEPRRVSIGGGSSEPLFAPEALAKIGELPPGFHDAMLSPDGTTIAGHYTDAAARSERMAVIPAAGGPATLLTTVPASASWAPDSRGLLYVETRAGISNLVRYSIATRTATPITRFDSDQIFWYSVAPNQQQVAMVRGRTSSDVVLVSADSATR